MGFLNLKREKPSRFQHAGKCFRRVEPKNQPIEKEHHLTQNLHFFGASSRFPVSITKQFPPCEQVPLVVRRQQMPVSLCGSVTTCCLLHSVRITPPQPQKPGSYTGFAEMANTQKKNPPFSVGRFPSSIIVYVPSSNGRKCKLPCDFGMGWWKPVKTTPKPPAILVGFWAGFPRVRYIHISVSSDSYQTKGRFSSPTLNQPTNQLFFYMFWLKKKKHVKSCKIIEQCILQDLLPNPQFHPIQHDSTTYFSNAAQKSKSIQNFNCSIKKQLNRDANHLGINFNRVFHYKPSILGYPYFRKPPFQFPMILCQRQISPRCRQDRQADYGSPNGFFQDVGKAVRSSSYLLRFTLQGINISHLGKRKIIFKMPFWGDMLVPWRVIEPTTKHFN